ncbi:MAG TPA: condensation domain-containing protein, partial [Candidatus Deferrimicrobium sp.]|nr:condensation domain-containing protein [Candidatus Deferrimicrobium sp.]
IYPNELILDPEKFLSRMNRDQITILEVVPSYLSVLLESTSVFPLSLQYLLVTGEEIKPFLVKKWFEKYPGIKMVNAYGPTEASDDITHYIMDKAPDMERIPIGKPVQNMNIYIVDNNMQLCPIGVKGEICVAGVGVGRGYLGDEEKTKQFFMEDPFVSPIPNESTSSVTNDHSPSPLTTQHSPIATHRLYKTGDLGCWLPDGNIEFFGRKDYQVKIRGFRIELGEIEEKLLRHPEIKEAVVVDKEDTLGNKYLCAYIVAHSVNLPDVTELKQYLSGSLPEYMIPAYFVSLGKIPLTSNGKIDRKALPAFDEIGNAHKYVAPTNPIEEKLVEIWIEVLDKDRGTIGIEHNFFDLGGHSLKAVVLVSKIHKEFDVRIPLIEVFRAPVIRELSHYIEMAIKDRFASIEPVEKKEYYTLSSAQKRLYIEQQMDLEGSTYSLPQIIVFNDRPNKTRLEETFQKLIARHENLRTSFHLINDVPFQKIHEHVEFAIDDFETDEKRAREVAERYQRTFDLSKAPLLKAALFNIEQKQYVLLIVIHHIITDAISYSLLKEDFQALYEGKPLPDLTLQYKDYSEWQNSPNQQERIKKQEVYWLKEFSGDIPLLNLFTDYARPAILDTGGRGISFTIEKKELEGLRGLAAEEGVTMFMLLLALLNILLSKFSGQEDILVGTPSAGRFHSDLEKIIGMFVNTL